MLSLSLSSMLRVRTNLIYIKYQEDNERREKKEVKEFYWNEMSFKHFVLNFSLKFSCVVIRGSEEYILLYMQDYTGH